MMPALRLKRFTESIIREMSRVAHQYRAVNLAQGFPDFDPPEALIEAAVTALRSGHNQYGLTWGTQSFRQALAEKQSRFMGLPLDPDTHITATCGSTEAMLAAFFTLLNPGDKVILFTPLYENYLPDAILTQVTPIFVPLRPPNFTFDRDELRAAFLSGAKALVLCNPSNPTGHVFSPHELQAIAELAQEFDAFVVTDEVYEHIVYEPHRHTYLAALPGMFERTISCGSLSKTYAITGWRLGYAIAPPHLTEGIRKIHDFLTIGAPTPFQEAAVTALRFPQAYYRQLQRDYTHRRALLLDYLTRAGLNYVTPQGAYYVLVDIARFGYDSDIDFCIHLARDIGVAAVPCSGFFPDGRQNFIRLNFAKRDETLHAAGERLLELSA